MLRGAFYRAPLLGLCLPLISGLLLGAGEWAPGLLFLALSSLGAYYGLKRKGWGYPALAALLFAFGLGWSYRILHPSLPPQHIARLSLPRITAVEGRLLRGTDPRPEGTAILMEAERVYLGGWSPARGRVRLFAEGEVPLEPGAVIRARVRLREPRNFSNPGGFDYVGFLRRQGIYVVGTIRGRPEVLEEGGDLFSGLRRGFREEVAKCPQRARGILKALILGERGEVGREDRELLQRTGTSHLLAISGLHIGIIGGFLVLILRLLLPGRRYLPALLALPLVWAYVILVQSPVSALRAALMAASLSLLVVLGRPRGLFNLLCLAALLILLFEPGALWSPSFQLSFLATAGIVLLAPRVIPPLEQDPLWALRERGKVLRPLLTAAVITLCAQGATLPVALGHFHLLSTIAPLANLVAVPAVAFGILPLGLIGLLLAWIWPALGGWVLYLDSLLVLGLLRILEALGSIPYSSLWLPGPTFWEGVLFYGGLLLFAFWRHIPRRALALAVFLGLWALDFTYWAAKARPTGNLEVAFLDVGQGDCAFLRLPSGERMLVDGGGFPYGDFDTGRSIVAPFLWSRRYLRVEHLVLSHPQPDHYKGLLFVAEHFRPKEFWLPPGDVPGELVEVIEELRRKGVRVRRLKRGQVISLGEVRFEVLNPPLPLPRDPNDASLVLRLEGLGRTVLFPGDVTQRAEVEMVRAGMPLRAEVLKVPHHGSGGASSYPFAREVAPLYAVISAGANNPFGHPHPRVVNRYRGLGAEVLRTDRCGFIRLLGDRKGWRVETMRACSAYPLLR